MRLPRPGGARQRTRQPVEASKARLNGLEAEARAIRKMLATVTSGDGFAPVADMVRVDRGFEVALGAALGDDLDHPLDASAPAHWAGNGEGADDPALPMASSADFPCHCPAGAFPPPAPDRLVDEVDASRLMALLKPGQRLVTQSRAIFRWDGHVTGSDAPSAAALRLAQKNRLSELEGEIDEAEIQLSEPKALHRGGRSHPCGGDPPVRQPRSGAALPAQCRGSARGACPGGAGRGRSDAPPRRGGKRIVAIAGAGRGACRPEEGLRAELEDAPDVSEVDRRLAEQQMRVAPSVRNWRKPVPVMRLRARNGKPSPPPDLDRAGAQHLEEPRGKCREPHCDTARTRG